MKLYKSLTILLLFILSLTAYSQENFDHRRPPHRGPHGGNRHRPPRPPRPPRRRRKRISRIGKMYMFYMRILPKIAREAGISNEKIDKIISIARKSYKKSIPLLALIKVQRLNIEEEFDKSVVNKRKILNIAKKLNNLKWKLHVLRYTSQVEIANILTLSERKKIKQIREHRFKRFLRRYSRRRRNR